MPHLLFHDKFETKQNIKNQNDTKQTKFFMKNLKISNQKEAL